MNELSGSVLIVLLVIVALAPRRWALLGMMAGVFFLTQGHSIDLFGLNMYPVRFLEAFAFARVIIRRELTWSRVNRMDVILILLYNYAAAIAIIRSPHASAYQFAAAMDPTLCYLSLRGLLHNLDDVRELLLGLVVLLIPFTGLVFMERITGNSAFTLVGAAPELLLRNGVARCQGSFRHAILLGSVAAAFLSLYVALWRAGVHRGAALLGGFLCLSLVVLSNSGGPLTSAAAVALGWAAWPLRRRLRVVRLVAFGTLIGLFLFMKAPIWYLPYKISSIVGGGGFHRGLLMERAWQDLGRWWLMGIDSKDTKDWIPYMLDAVGGADVTNQFLVFALNGGIAALLLCIALLVVAFRRLGAALEALRQTPSDRADELLIWGLGVTLLVHVVTWLGVSYFDQSWVIWLTHVAAISVAVCNVPVAVPERPLSVSPAAREVRPFAPPTAAQSPRLGRAPDSSVIGRRRLVISDFRKRHNR